MPPDSHPRDRGAMIPPERIFGRPVTRRGFLKRTAGGALALGAASLLPSGCAKYPPAPEGMRVFNAKEHAVINAATVIYAGEDFSKRGIDAAAFFDGSVTRLPGWAQKQIKQALALFEHGPLIFSLKPKRFTQLSHADQVAYVDGWAESGLGFRRTVHWAMRQICLSSIYLQAPSWQGIHYAGPWIGRVRVPAAAPRFPLPEGSVKT